MSRPEFSLQLADPRMRAGVTWEAWDPWTSNSSALHPGWYADDPADYVGAFAGMFLGPDTAMRVSVVNRCVNLRANTVAALPCHLLRQDGDRKEKARDHRAYRAVRKRPNTWMTRWQFFRDMQAKLDLHGRAFARLIDDGRVIMMVPLDPKRVQVEQRRGGELRYQYDNPDTNRKEPLLQHEVLYLRDLSADFVTGQARASLAREAVAVAAAAQEFVKRFFVNDASGRLVFEHPGRFESKEKREEFENWLRSRVQGTHNAHRPLLAYGGMKVQELAKAGDQDFLVDPRTFQAADIARFWGVPGVLIGLEEKTSSWGTGVAEIKQGFVDFTIKPETINWAESLGAALLDDDEQDEFFFEFEFGALLQANPSEQAAAFKTLKETGAINANEIRARLNMNPRTDPGGEQFQDNAPGSAPNAAAAAAATPPAGGTEDTEARLVPVPLVADASERIAGAMRHGGQAKRREQVVRIVAPLVDAFGLPAMVVSAAADRISRAAVTGSDVTPEQRLALVRAILEETLTAGAAMARAEAA